jgi:hypothetical protein
MVMRLVGIVLMVPVVLMPVVFVRRFALGVMVGVFAMLFMGMPLVVIRLRSGC